MIDAAKASSLLYLAALFSFCAATFQIAGSRWILAVVFFGAAVCFSCVAGKLRKKAQP